MFKYIKNILIKAGIFLFCCALFFIVLPMFNHEADQEKKAENLELYGEGLEKPVSDTNHIALFGKMMPFPLKMSELPEEFHIEDMYYEEMSDGIEAGDYFHCDLLNADNEPIAYIRVSNLKQNKADSPDGMTVTYIEASSFKKGKKEYAVPFEIIGGVGIGSDYDEVKALVPELEGEVQEDYFMASAKLGIQTVLFEFLNRKVYKMSVEAYSSP